MVLTRIKQRLAPSEVSAIENLTPVFTRALASQGLHKCHLVFAYLANAKPFHRFIKENCENGIKPSKRTDQRTIPNFLFFLYKKDCYAS